MKTFKIKKESEKLEEMRKRGAYGKERVANSAKFGVREIS